MSIIGLIFKELRHRWLNFALGVLGMVAIVALFVAYLGTAAAAQRETVRVTRDLGFNLRIIPKETDMDRFWALGYSELTLPEEAVRRLANHPKVFVSYNHLVATLQRRVAVESREILLTGLAPAITAPEQRNRPMGLAPKPGTVVVGYRVAERLGLKQGGPVTILGGSFVVDRCLAESGTEEDIRVYGALGDVQRLLGLAGKISEIQAIDCLCLTADQDPLRVLRAELERALPEAKVVQLRTLADTRAKQRQTAERYFAVMSPLLLVICAAWVALFATLNVRERRLEIGVLRALGHSSGRIAALFLGRAVLLGVLAAALGWALGTGLALRLGPDIFRVTASAIAADYGLLGKALLAAPLFAAVATAVPTMHAVTLDPAAILREA